MKTTSSRHGRYVVNDLEDRAIAAGGLPEHWECYTVKVGQANDAAETMTFVHVGTVKPLAQAHKWLTHQEVEFLPK